MIKYNKWTIGLLSGTVLASTLVAVPEASAAVEPIKVSAEAAFVIDNETNKILLDQNGDESLYIASMTKMIPLYLVHEAVEAGTISWDTPVPVSEYAVAISQNYELSNVPLREDFTYTVKDLYEAMVIYSANGATIAVAELIGGTEHAFVDMMKAKLDEWGITGYSLFNTTGLPNHYADELGNLYPGAPVDEENKMTARGIATVADHLLDDYPEILETAKIEDKIFMEGSGDEIHMMTYNLMLPNQPYAHTGVDGLKTGTTDASGASFAGTAVEEDRRVITVVIGAEDNSVRFGETSRLMDFAFDNFEKVQIAAKGDAVKTEEPLAIAKGKEEEVGLVYSEDVFVVTPNTDEELKVETEMSLNPDLLNEDGQVEAPIEKGTTVGNVTLSIEGDDLGYLDGSLNEAAVAVERTVEKANVFVLAWRWIASTASQGWNTVTDFIGGFFN
ncbi:serine hydrolase [Jeotgalibaca sp. A122]|uniref:serine hydrolase n=1 Tax=Jeotgalibaca sp. A122 TaxID=3457322 RepID=UPI003FD65925